MNLKTPIKNAGQPLGEKTGQLIFSVFNGFFRLEDGRKDGHGKAQIQQVFDFC